MLPVIKERRDSRFCSWLRWVTHCVFRGLSLREITLGLSRGLVCQ